MGALDQSLADILSSAGLSRLLDERLPLSDDLIDWATEHGLLALLANRFQTFWVSNTRGFSETEIRFGWVLKGVFHQAAMSALMLEGETRRLLAVMANSGIEGLLLKGQAIAEWAYTDPSHRASGDIDVLVATREVADQLTRCLCETGYELFQPSGDLVALEMMLRREVAPQVWVEIDLHCRVINSPLFAERFTFEELMAESIALPRLGANARGLGPAHAFIHACMHWAATLAVGADIKLKWLYDIPAFAKVFTPTDWERLEQLAVERGLAGVCLGMIEASQAAFGADFVAVPQDLIAALREAVRHEPLDVTRLRDWRYMQMQTLLAQPTLRLRVRYLWQRLWPSRDYMAFLYGRPDLSYFGLIAVRAKTALRRFFRLQVSDR